MIKIILLFLTVVFISCNQLEKEARLLVDAGSFLDESQTKIIDNTLKDFKGKTGYSMYLYTVIAEKYYSQPNYEEFVFSTISKGDSLNNRNILLYLSYDDKRVILHTGNKARETLTDSLGQVVISTLTPYLSQEDYFNGFKVSIDHINEIFSKRQQTK